VTQCFTSSKAECAESVVETYMNDRQTILYRLDNQASRLGGGIVFAGAEEAAA
jgi:hypothetical protein